MPPIRSRSKRGRKPKAKFEVTDDGHAVDLRCDVCEKVFTTKNSLKQHKNGHTREVVYPCEICGRTFLRQVYVRTHMKVHDREKELPALPYKCTKGVECKQSFKTQALLDTHLEKHTHLCPFCPESAITRRLLNYHIMRHTGTFPESCKGCKKWFTSLEILRTHKCRKPTKDKNKE